MTTWRDASVEKPTRRCGVLVFVHRRITAAQPTGYCGIHVAQFDGEYFDLYNVTHWMPLPPLPGDEPDATVALRELRKDISLRFAASCVRRAGVAPNLDDGAYHALVDELALLQLQINDLQVKR